LEFSKRRYPKGTCPRAEALLKKSFLIPFNENYSEAEMVDIAGRVVAAVQELTD
jgi:hypothetical protein